MSYVHDTMTHEGFVRSGTLPGSGRLEEAAGVATQPHLAIAGGYATKKKKIGDVSVSPVIPRQQQNTHEHQ